MTDTRELIERFNAAWQRGDLATLSELLDEDVVYCPNAWDGPARTAHGRNAVIAVFAEQIGPTRTEQISHSPTERVGSGVTGQGSAGDSDAEEGGFGEGPVLGDVFASGERAVCEWQWQPAGDGTVLRGVDVYRVRDGRIVAKDVYGKITAPPPR
ncbi:hypothetical protein Aph02nite_25200 [Actinoplanes philippinensis]|uniref:Ketosteroid isomerase-related protein n=1 Tax=Actinoplanes philippinensis TaxID=35752 RepID=A0A1I2G2T2_9ACTN|nr:nuclear transport factor 2 family protein [Actinoplanes philippinensis]GIE76570.1 hypothetical protein Aph02nite_25200 [Actinoplanes philippinensis]SFF11935.1 Ketosteroid isomerase-related protein [Actinoplanes philippinensis]